MAKASSKHAAVRRATAGGARRNAREGFPTQAAAPVQPRSDTAQVCPTGLAATRRGARYSANRPCSWAAPDQSGSVTRRAPGVSGKRSATPTSDMNTYTVVLPAFVAGLPLSRPGRGYGGGTPTDAVQRTRSSTRGTRADTTYCSQCANIYREVCPLQALAGGVVST